MLWISVFGKPDMADLVLKKLYEQANELACAVFSVVWQQNTINCKRAYWKMPFEKSRLPQGEKSVFLLLVVVCDDVVKIY